MDRLKESLHPYRKKYHRDFYALKDIDLEVKERESVGIIGSNGSGKSTLLKIITGVLTPSSGSVSVNGRISSLLELGAGFNPELTGIENIYFSGTIMGYTRNEIDAKLDDIISFADIGDFIGQPVKTYSSGMYVRLAFASAVHVDPDVLIVDEALAVGDFRFRQKCAEKMNELRSKATVILVSHSMRDIQMLCSKAVVMDRGVVEFLGSANDAVDFYMAKMESEEEAKKKDLRSAPIKQAKQSTSPYGEIFSNLEKIAEVSHRWVGADGNEIGAIEHGESIALEFSFRLLKPVKELVIGVPIWNSSRQMMTALNSDRQRIKIHAGEDGMVRGKLKMDRLVFNPDTYTSYLAIVDAKEYLYRNRIGEFRVKELPLYFGQMTPVHEWQFDQK